MRMTFTLMAEKRAGSFRGDNVKSVRVCESPVLKQTNWEEFLPLLLCSFDWQLGITEEPVSEDRERSDRDHPCWESWPYTHTHTGRHVHTLTHTHTHTHADTHADTHARRHAHVCFLWIVGTFHRPNVFYTVKPYFLSPYTNPTPKSNPYRKFSAFLLSQKNSFCMI